MNIDRINYQRVFPIGSYATHRVGLEATLDKDENPELALQRLQIIVNELHASTLSELEQYRGTTVRTIGGEHEQQVDKVPNELQAVLDGIDACTEIDGTGEHSLSTFWLRSKGNLMLSSAYKIKEKQLTDAK